VVAIHSGTCRIHSIEATNEAKGTIMAEFIFGLATGVAISILVSNLYTIFFPSEE